MKICILTAGKGTRMGKYGEKINKSLLPIRNKAIITHILDSFSPNDEFVVAIGCYGQQVKDYLKIAHPDRKIKFVNIENYENEGSGPGLSLLMCEPLLREPFYYMPCDCILRTNLENLQKNNWIGVTKVSVKESSKYCNVAVQNGQVIDIRDKLESGTEYFAFSAPLYVKDYKIFWDSLKSNKRIQDEHQISNGIKGLMNKSNLTAIEIKWENLGDLEKYQDALSEDGSFDFSKPDESTYFVNDKVIKFFANSKNIKGKIKKFNLNPKLFPQIISMGENFLYYSYFKGDVFYSINDAKAFELLLEWLETNLWKPVQIEKNQMYTLCQEFYFTKTIDRINQFKKKYPNYQLPCKVNGTYISKLDEILEKIPWAEIFNGSPYFIHGDLNFGNVLYNKNKNEFCLIDWRQDFAGIIEYGDIYYDLAKLYAGIIINFEHIRQNLFQYNKTQDSVQINFHQWDIRNEYIQILEEYITSKNFNLKKVRTLAGLTYINMAPLHKTPFDLLLMSLGSKIINDEIFTNNNTS